MTKEYLTSAGDLPLKIPLLEMYRRVQRENEALASKVLELEEKLRDARRERKRRKPVKDMIEIQVRAPESTAAMAQYIGDDGVLLVLCAHLMLSDAEELAGVNEKRCYAALIERSYLLDVVNEFIWAKALMGAEAKELNR